jgi:hypothetical protein
MGLMLIPLMIYEHGEPRWDVIDRVKPKKLKKSCPSATLSTTNPNRTDPGVNRGLRDERPATSRLRHGLRGLTRYVTQISLPDAYF